MTLATTATASTSSEERRSSTPVTTDLDEEMVATGLVGDAGVVADDAAWPT
jgi:hypothetical protein